VPLGESASRLYTNDRDLELKIAIVGGGVIGLSVACRLSRHDHCIAIVSGQYPSQTTSSVAAAYWGPYFIGSYDRNWAIETWHELRRLAMDPELASSSGTSLVDFREWLCDEDRSIIEDQLNGLSATQSKSDSVSIAESQPYWWRDLPGIHFELKPLDSPITIDLPDEGTKRFTAELRFQSVVARMPDYLQYLQDQALVTGKVEYVSEWIDGFDELLDRFDIVVNCTGWGAKRLVASDPATARMKLLAGLVVRVEAPEQGSAISLGHGSFAKSPLYIVPRHGSRTDSICGGTAIELEGDIDPRLPFPMDIADACDRIYRRCVAASQSIGKGLRCENLAGLRPVRDSVRIERDPQHDRLIHCYGHGGSGLTLSWGSANQVDAMVCNQM
jgi:D-amino-acid oxidase